MKNFSLVLLVVSSLLFQTCNNESSQSIKELKTPKDNFSYAIGLDIGASLEQLKEELNLDVVFQGIRDTLNKSGTLLSPEEVAAVTEEVFKRLKEKQDSENAKLMEENLEKEKSFLAENKKKEDVVTTESGLQYVVLKEGSGPTAKASDVVKVNYKGTLLNGTEFDNSYKRGQPVEFPVGGVIKGWTEALQLMNVGSQYRLFIPSALAYGERGAGKTIPPNSALIFDVELLEIVN